MVLCSFLLTRVSTGWTPAGETLSHLVLPTQKTSQMCSALPECVGHRAWRKGPVQMSLTGVLFSDWVSGLFTQGPRVCAGKAIWKLAERCT